MNTPTGEASPEGAVTPLITLHRELDARLVVFAGVQLPVQYPAGIIKEHLHTRSHAGLFDVSHMGQLKLHGKDAAKALESLTPGNIIGLGEGRQRYTLFTNDTGGIEDDLMVSNAGDHLFVVVNAARKEHDLALLRRGLSNYDCTLETLDERALLALQGPRAAEVLGALAPQLGELLFMQARTVELAGAPCFVARSGYSGEDGFEISVPNDAAEALARRLLAHEAVLPVGLGARDSLRLEAGLCLYGHDLDEHTSPVEADLRWAIPKVRRSAGARAGGFPGAATILAQLQDGAERIRTGIQTQGRVPVREGAELRNADGEPCGRVSSGGYGPSIKGPVAMGYVERRYAETDTELHAIVRGKAHAVRVRALPFTPHRYYRG